MRPETPTIEDRAQLQNYIHERSTEIEGRLGIFIGFPESDDSFDIVATINPETAFASASVIKLPILHALYDRHQDDLAKLSEPHGLKDRNCVGGSGLYHLLGDVKPSLRDLARAMISISDNTATNELIDYLGFKGINNQAELLGMTETKLQRRMMVSLSDNDLMSKLEINGEPANTIAPKDCAQFFSDLIQEKTLSTEAYDELRIPLREQKHVSIFPRYLPYETHIEHKTGSLPTAALDTGLIVAGGAAEDRPLLYAVFVDQMDQGADGADFIAEIGDAVYAWLKSD
jgi:beta-lactamase class A